MEHSFSGNWSLPSEFGAPFMSGELTTEARPTQKKADRKSERVALELGAGLRQRGGTGVGIQILDLSVDGFRASTHLQLEKGSDVWLRLPGLEARSYRYEATDVDLRHGGDTTGRGAVHVVRGGRRGTAYGLHAVRRESMCCS